MSVAKASYQMSERPSTTRFMETILRSQIIERVYSRGSLVNNESVESSLKRIRAHDIISFV